MSDLLSTVQGSVAAVAGETTSTDKWVQRARPTILYVMYVMILWSIPMGLLYTIAPVTADQITAGMQKWLAAIPQALWDVFTFVGLGYIAGRSVEKVKGVAR
jgi:hypothetical protein